MSSAFPNMGLDPNQVAMLAVSFAQQFDFFTKMAEPTSGESGSNFLRTLTMSFGLIGFCYILLMKEAWNGIVVGSWLLLLLIVATGPYFEKLFFYEFDVRQQTTPADVTGTLTTAETINQQARAQFSNLVAEDPEVRRAMAVNPQIRDLIMNNEVYRARQSALDGKIFMYTPQVAAIHLGNLLQEQIVLYFESEGGRSLTGRLGAIEALRQIRLGDYRAVFDQAAFRAVCTPKVGGRIEQAFLTRDMLEAAQRDQRTGRASNPNAAYAQALRNATLNAYDVYLIHDIYWQEVANRGLQRPTTGNNRNRQPVVPALPPLASLTSSRQLQSLPPEVAAALNQMAATPLTMRNGRVTGVGGDNSTNIWGEYYTNSQGRQASFNNLVRPQIGNEANVQLLRSIPVTLVMGDIDENGRAQSSLNWFQRFVVNLFGGNTREQEIKSCYEMQLFAMASAQRAMEQQASLDESIDRVIQQANASIERQGGILVDGQRYPNLYAMPQELRIRQAYAIELASRQARCSTARGQARPPECANPQQLEFALRNALTMQAMRNSNPEVDGLLRRAMARGDFYHTTRNIAREVGEWMAPGAMFFKGLFGGFGAGTYAGIVPYILAWALGLVIMLTPFIYVIGLLVPMWAPSILITPILVVAYLKMVEVSMVLIKFVFRTFNNIYERGFSFADGGMTNMQDILLGSAYTAAFAIALFLMFGLKDPAGLLKQVSGSADKTAQISAQEAMGMLSAGLGALKLGAALIPGVGKVAGAALLAADAMKGASGGSGADGGDGGSASIMNRVGHAAAVVGKTAFSPISNSFKQGMAETYLGAKSSSAEAKGKYTEMQQVRKMERGELPVQADPVTGKGQPRTMEAIRKEEAVAKVNKMAISVDSIELDASKKAYFKNRLESIAGDANVDQHVGKRVRYDNGVRKEEKLPISAVASMIGKDGKTALNLQPDPRTGRVGQYAIDAKSTEITMQATARGYFKEWSGLQPDQITEDMRKAASQQILADLQAGGLKDKWGSKS